MFIRHREVCIGTKPTKCNAKALSATIVDMRVDVLHDRNHSCCPKWAVVLMNVLDQVTKLGHCH